jgi:hypothetical protein
LSSKPKESPDSHAEVFQYVARHSDPKSWSWGIASADSPAWPVSILVSLHTITAGKVMERGGGARVANYIMGLAYVDHDNHIQKV